MLGNSADAFYMTPMPTRITTQANRPGYDMPAPRPTSRVNRSFLPGLGQADMLPGMGASDMLPGMGQLNLGRNTMLIGGAAVAFLFLTKAGKRMRRRIGLA